MFIEVKASKKSLASRKLVHGVGVNDSDYMTNHKDKFGKWSICPFYRKWKNMLKRCYSTSDQNKYPTYNGCIVSDEWVYFSNFKSWMEKQDWQGKQLDKDILVQGNKVYGAEYCIFVTNAVNTLFVDQRASRGKYPLGVSRRGGAGKYMSACSKDGKLVVIGRYPTALVAHDAYKAFKYKLIADIASNQIEPLKSALLNYRIGI